jgi:hypothetical protein
MFQGHEVCHSSAIILSLFIYYYTNLVNKSVFQILEFHHATEINNKWKP